jgi:hypothetical protein
MTRRHPLAALLACALVAFVARPATAQDISPDSPKGAASAFFKAMENGDAKAAKSLAVGSDKQLSMLDLLVPVVSSFKQLENAAVKKWGEDARKTLSQGQGSSMDFDKELKAATEKVEGDTATITSAKPEQQREPMKLKKVDGKWKVDMSSVPAEGLDNPQTSQMMKVMSDAAKSTATEIEQGKYASAQDARQAMTQKILPAIMKMQQEQQQKQGGPGAPGAPGAGAPGAGGPGGGQPQPQPKGDNPK